MATVLIPFTPVDNVLNAVPTMPGPTGADLDGLAVSGSQTAAAVLFTQDMLGYNSITVEVNSAGTTCTITYEHSDDNVNWNSCAGMNPASTGTSAAVVTSTAAITLRFPKYSRYFRARVSTYNSGTVTVVGTCHKAQQVVNVAAFVQGSAGQGGVVAGSPVPIAFEARSAQQTPVANGQIVRPIATLDGSQIVRTFAIPEDTWKYVAAASGLTNTTTAVTIIAAAGAGLRNYITGFQLQAGTLGAAGEYVIRDGAAGTVIWRTRIETTGIPAGLNVILPSPIAGTANTLMEFAALTASVTGAVYINVQGFAAP